MDLLNPQSLMNILSPEELDRIPADLHDKLKNNINKFFEDYCKEKAAASRLDDYERRVQELQSQIQDYEVKIQNYSENVNGLREQLDLATKERMKLLELSQINENELTKIRLEKNSVIEERDSLYSRIERQCSEIDRLKDEVRSYQTQLNNTISAKCKAIAKMDEIESRETAIEFKERHMEQERNMLHLRIESLSEELNRNLAELHALRQENTTKTISLETRLSEKIEEIKIAQSQCAQYKENIEQLNQTIQDLSKKCLNQNEETNKLLDHFKKELEAKSKLADLYKCNSEDTIMERNELSSVISDLRRLLAESSDMYGELETKYNAAKEQYEKEIDEKTKIINEQKLELDHANVLLKEVQNESVEAAISKLAPSAVVASRLIKSDMSLTELYSLFVKTTEELEHEKRENNQLNLQIKTILSELSETVPNIKKQEVEYEKLLEVNNALESEREYLINKKTEMEERLSTEKSKVNQLERENKKLRQSQCDLSRQVCYLLKEIEEIRVGCISKNSQNAGNLSTTNDVISVKLVTFKNIAELQENNQKLLLVVRDLSTKLESVELMTQQYNESYYKEKLENYEEKFNNLQETLNKQNNTIALLLSKSERYKTMYFEMQKKNNKSQNAEHTKDADMSEPEDYDKGETTKVDASTTQHNTSINERRMREMEHQLRESQESYKRLKEQYEYYIQEKKNNDKLLNEQFDTMKKEVGELSATNCKLMSSFEYSKEQIKLQQKNIANFKQEIATLEERNRNYETTVVKHEQTVLYLKDEIIKVQREYSVLESEVNHLRQENCILKDANARFHSEKESYYREQQNQNLLLNNIEQIKSNLERSEMEGRNRLQQRLDESIRELSAQRRRYQEEEDRYRETINNFKRQIENTKKQMEDEKSQANKLREEISELREAMSVKCAEVDGLSKKLQESLTPSHNDNPIVQANKKARECEAKYEKACIELLSLQKELATAKEHSNQYCKMAQSAETEIKNLHELHANYVEKSEAEIERLRNTEKTLKKSLADLEAEVQLSAVTEKLSNQSDQTQKLQDELREALQKLGETNRNLKELQAENVHISESLSAVQSKYANEMNMHSADLQELTRIKEELTKAQDKIQAIYSKRDATEEAYEDLKKYHAETIALFEKEKVQFEERIADLNSLNTNLHDQIEALTLKLSSLSHSKLNTSITDESLMETSNIENIEKDAAQNNEQLLQIIKFLRKEKDLTNAKLDILKAENSRLKSEQTILQKKMDEVKVLLNQERTKSESLLNSTTKHEEILRKIETLNAITDSNRILREERNLLERRVKELNEHISSVENELFPLQNHNRELNSKIEELNMENASLKSEAIKWRQRANVLVEKSNKNPEEFKRLQTERENLAKMLTAEKDQLKKLTDELNTIKTEKLRNESEMSQLQKQVQISLDEKKKVLDDMVSVKQNSTRMLQEIMELKNKLLQKEEQIQKLTDEVDSKDAQLQDSKNKEVQIRKIAKRYKDSYLELSNKSTGGTGDAATANQSTQDNLEVVATVNTANAGADGSGISTPNAEVEQLRNKIENSNLLIRNMQEENEKLRKDNEELKATVEIDERTKILLRDAKTRIVSLTDAKNAVMQELASTKTKLHSFMQSSESHDAAMNELKNQYEETFSRMEKELFDQNNLKDTVARLTRDNEALLMKINQLNRQMGLQQVTKPTTSSVTMNEKSSISELSPRTANVKPMSGSSNVQQSATVTPWRGSETPLASIRPISVQNSRTAAILPTSQQTVGGSSSSTATTSALASCSNTALVPPQQVHTTGTTSATESMSSSPTSSHNDFMPSTSSASVAVAAIPPMGTTSGPESSQEAESIGQPQLSEPQLIVSQQQAVALVSPRVEASSQNAQSPNVQLQQEPNNQQPSTSGSTNSTHPVFNQSNQSRQTPSSSNVTTTQSGPSANNKRARENEGDSSTNTDGPSSEKLCKITKRLRGSSNSEEDGLLTGVTGGMEVEYQVPTSSQRDQEDDIVIVDSEEDEIIEADDGPANGEVDTEGYFYEQENEMDENDCREINNQVDTETDTNEVDIEENITNQNQAQSESTNQEKVDNASTSEEKAPDSLQKPQQQNEAISSVSYEKNSSSSSSSTPISRKHASSSSVRHQKPLIATSDEKKEDITESHCQHSEEAQNNVMEDDEEGKPSNDDGIETEAGISDTLKEEATVSNENEKNFTDEDMAMEGNEVGDDFCEDSTVANEATENRTIEGSETNATQSDVQDIQPSQMDASIDNNELPDMVSSEGEKQTIEEIEEDREAVATTSPSVNTRSKTTRGGSASGRKANRGFPRGGGRPTPIIWQGNSRNNSPNQRNPEQSLNQRGFPNQRSQRARRMRRPSGNYGNMRYS